MDRLRTLLGLTDDNKRIYRFEDGEVDRDEFEYTRVMFNYLFDEEKGLVATLGPTWNLIHDPRFNTIENCFIRERKNIFSAGNTLIGQQIITGAFSGFAMNVQELEQYATILGEGRHFLKVVNAGLLKDEDGDVLHPSTLYQDSDKVIWGLIRQECPNYFTMTGSPNYEATKLYNLIKADLIGLVSDYAELPFVDEFVNSESGDVFEPTEWDGETPIIYVEVDMLEKALTLRGALRVTAARILDRLGFSDHISGGERLTSFETDDLLRMVYTSKWPDERLELTSKVIGFVMAKNATPFAEREAAQLRLASDASKEFVAKIKSGEITQLNRKTDAPTDTTMDPQAAIIKSIQDNPYKRDLFMMLTDAEQTGNARVAEYLLPFFESADTLITETMFQDIVRQVRSIQGGKRPTTTTVEGYLE